MNTCDQCQQFANKLESLDGFTLLCDNCKQRVLHQHAESFSPPELLTASLKTVWIWMMKHSIPFRVTHTPERILVVSYGSNELLGVTDLLQDWTILSEAQFPKDLIAFGKPSDHFDPLGIKTKASIEAYQKEHGILLLEQYACWIKIQFVLDFPQNTKS